MNDLYYYFNLFTFSQDKLIPM